ncbi:MAG: GGDEF domain-containing protein [Catonella sp.]|uniref:GGDEF domain-containing protein n=1 Tax=Catonella sp. TaxID=2382125 RepID=UPI003F9FBC15
MQIYEKLKEKSREKLGLSTINSKIVLAGIIISIIVVFFVSFVVSGTITNLEERLIGNRLEADINYVKDLVSGNDNEAKWNVRGDTIYFGDNAIGDGTAENANLTPFLEHYAKTGTMAYIFMKVSDDDPKFKAAQEQKLGYEVGHYYRVAGSTLSDGGKSILGTFMTKNVADELDRKGVYSGEANVAGGMIFCLYRVLEDKDGFVVGAVVVGRSIREMNHEIGKAVVKVALFTLFIIGVIIVIIFVIISQFLNTINSIVFYLRQLEVGVIPNTRLNIRSISEVNLVVESINNLVGYLRENLVLQKKSEIDALTGLPNRMSYDEYSVELEKYLHANQKTLGVEILDIDYFKQYNDNYGHQNGDECIKMIAGELQKLVQDCPKIYAARYGGDEFVIIYPGLLYSEVEGFVKMLKKNVQGNAMEHKFSKAADVVTVTQGVCFDIFSQGKTIADFLKRADEALYEEKKIGRNSYRIIQM